MRCVLQGVLGVWLRRSWMVRGACFNVVVINVNARTWREWRGWPQRQRGSRTGIAATAAHICGAWVVPRLVWKNAMAPSVLNTTNFHSSTGALLSKGRPMLSAVCHRSQSRLCRNGMHNMRTTPCRRLPRMIVFVSASNDASICFHNHF